MEDQEELPLQDTKDYSIIYYRFTDVTFGTRLRAAWAFITAPIMLVLKGRTMRIRIEKRKP